MSPAFYWVLVGSFLTQAAYAASRRNWFEVAQDLGFAVAMAAIAPPNINWPLLNLALVLAFGSLLWRLIHHVARRWG